MGFIPSPINDRRSYVSTKTYTMGGIKTCCYLTQYNSITSITLARISRILDYHPVTLSGPWRGFYARLRYLQRRYFTSTGAQRLTR
jgi:hypothetical protein